MRVLKAAVIVSLFSLLPSPFCSGVLTGVVKDASGAVLPGVTVEAASPALIEKVRTAVTDGTGLYRIIDLRPGTYSLTFTLPGFNIVKREGIELTGTVDADDPRRDAGRRARGDDHGHRRDAGRRRPERAARDGAQRGRHRSHSGDARRRLAAERHARPDRRRQRPRRVADDDVLQRARRPDQRRAHDGQRHDGRGGVQRRRRVVVHPTTRSTSTRSRSSSSGGLGESDIGGPVMNLVPRSGGNTFRGQAFFNNAGDWSRGNNLTDELRAVGLTETPGIIKLLRRERLVRRPDQARPALVLRQLSQARHGDGGRGHRRQRERRQRVALGLGRRTPSVTARQVQGRDDVHRRGSRRRCPHKHRFSFNHEYQHRCEGAPLKVEHRRLPQARRRLDRVWNARPRRPKRNPNYFDFPYYLTQATLDGADDEQAAARGRLHPFSFTTRRTSGSVPPDGIFDLISVTEQSTAINPATGLRYAPRANFVYRGVATANDQLRQPEQLARLGVVRHRRRTA